MNSMSIPQALDIWHELEEALRGKNSYGGDTAEIYAYRVSPSRPSFEGGGGLLRHLGDSASLLHTDAWDHVKQSKRDLCDICRYFERLTEAKVTFVDFEKPLSIDEWEASEDVFAHRIHVRVKKSAKKKEP